MEVSILIFKFVNLSTKSAKNRLSKVQNQFMKVQLSNSKSEKLVSKVVILKEIIHFLNLILVLLKPNFAP